MNEFHPKINNSYESSDSSGGSASSSEQRCRRSSSYDAMEKGSSLSNLLMPPTMTELHCTSLEASAFTNINQEIIEPLVAPSYEPEYDYYNEYSTTPLVYSWMPIVPGFSQELSENLDNFEHIMKRLKPQPLNISNIDEATLNSDKHAKFSDSMVLNSSSNYHFQRLELLDSSKEVNAPFSHQLEDSSNAMDLNISCHAPTEESTNINIDLSFNGKINEMNSTTIYNDNSNADHAKMMKEEEEVHETQLELDIDETEEERIRNESFELLKKEDSSKMIFVNEKSPQAVDETEDEESDEQQQGIYEPIEERRERVVDNIEKSTEIKSLIDCDTFILDKLQTSLSGLSVPFSIATLPLSLSEMLSTYEKNISKSFVTNLKSSSLFIPSHPLSEVLSMEWPQLAEIKAHGIMYNRSTDCEDIEMMRLRYTDRFIRAETTTSFTHKNGPTSVKKRIERLKLLAQSPGSRLSHLANRRKIFSSASLKSTSINASHKSLGSGFLIDKSKLYQKKKRNSAKKKTPGKKKTPKSAKRYQQQLKIAKPEATLASSKRALFTSPMAGSSSLISQSRENLTTRGVLPRRNLFSPQNAKRKRSPSPDDTENRFGKSRRLESPSRHNQLVSKSKSFSSAAPLSSSATYGSLEDHYKKTLLYRTQSEMALNQSTSSDFGRNNNLGYRKPLSDVDKKKLLWAASSALQSKQINREHEKFKDYMSTLCRLVKKILAEFYHPNKSMSHQMQKFANMMVFYVTQGRLFDDIYATTKTRLDIQNPTKVSGYIAPADYEKNRYIRKNSSLLLLSNVSGSCSSLNYSSNNSDSILDGAFDKSGSDTSLNQSLNKNNNNNAENNVLRENFHVTTRENSTRKLYGGSDFNINKLVSTTSTPSSNILKAKRQISF